MNLNPFDLRGPEFLVFYLLAIVGVAVMLRWIRRIREGGQDGEAEVLTSELAQDPYQAACLRGGKNEVISVAVVSLLERGLLRTKGDRLEIASSDARNKVRRPLDKAILTKYANPQAAKSIFLDQTITTEAEGIENDLKNKGLLPTDSIKTVRKGLIAFCLMILWGLAGVKVFIALSRGHSNFLILLGLALVSLFLLLFLIRRPRTVLGDDTKKRLETLFEGLNTRKAGLQFQTTSSELTYLAAIFGMAALPMSVAAMITPLNMVPPRAPSNWWNTGNGGCSSCGTFSSCSGGGGGSSCGGSSCGGGCGGGCGGCGG